MTEFNLLIKNTDGNKSYYQMALEEFILNSFGETSDYPLFSVLISISMGKRTKNVPLIYAILDRLPPGLFKNDKGNIIIQIETEKDFTDSSEQLMDLMTVVKTWKSLKIALNGSEISYPEFEYLVDYFFERNKHKAFHYRKTDLKKKYISKKRNIIHNSLFSASVKLSRVNPVDSLQRVMSTYIEIYGVNKDVQQFNITEYDRVISIEDDFIISFRLTPKSWRRENDEFEKDWEFPVIMIQELTYNNLYKFNYQEFRRCFSFEYIGIEFLKFHGFHYYIDKIDGFDFVNKKLPELHLLQRMNDYGGETHHFIILKMDNVSGETVFGIGETKNKVHSFILKLCGELETKNSRTLEIYGASCLPYFENIKFINAFLSWKGERKKWRLENKFSYYYVDMQIKNDSDVPRALKDILKNAEDGEFENCEFGSYTKPINKWKSEELVYNITKQLYKEYQVIYQFRPYYLATDKGNMSYDIYICGLRIAIEYQGKQHFEPVEYFGGKENYEKQHERDILKARLSEENGIRLIYINYWEDITPELIKNKVEMVR